MCTVGESIGTLKVGISRARLVQYAGASGDFNPIHWQESYAVAAGLPGVIAHGMLTMGLASELVSRWARDPGRILSYGTRFAAMVPVPDTDEVELQVEGKIAQVTPEGIGIELAVTLEGKKVLARTYATVRP